MIVAVDPGGATGIAMLQSSGFFETATVLGGAEGTWSWLTGLFASSTLDAVVIENFVPRGGALSIQLDALHIIGAVKYLCWTHSIPLVIQTPTQAKSFASNDHLKAVGWYAVGADHERDAARHMLVYMAKSQAFRATDWPYRLERVRILNALAAM